MPYQNRNNSPMLCFILVLYIYYFYSFNFTYIKYKYAKYAVDQICLLRMCLGCSVLFRALYCFQSESSTPCQNLLYVLQFTVFSYPFRHLQTFQTNSKFSRKSQIVIKFVCALSPGTRLLLSIKRCYHITEIVLEVALTPIIQAVSTK